MALQIPTLAQLIEQAKQDLETDSAGGLQLALRTALAYALAGLAYGYYLGLRYLSLQYFIDTAEDAYKLLWASIYGVEPNAATPAQGLVQLTGTDGTIVALGQVVQRNSDGAQYTATAGGTVLAGELKLAVQANLAGAAGNAEDGVAFSVISPPAGIDAAAVTVDGGLTDGFDAETAAAVGERTLQQIRAPNISGAEGDYEVWATAVAGIAQAYATDAFAGIGTVLVIVAQEYDPTDPGSSPIPSAALIAEVEDYIEPRKPAGLYLVAVQPPTLQPLNPHIVLEPDTPEIRDAVQRSLALALADVRPGTVAYYDDLVDAINRAAGEEHHQLWTQDQDTLAWGPYNTDVGNSSLMTTGTPTWTAPP